MAPDLGELRRRVDSIIWYHSIDLGHGIVTDGFSKSFLKGPQLPDFAGKTVLDIGAWDGYYSFLAERGGASRVVALDHYAWGVDFARRNHYWIECSDNGVLPDHNLDTTAFWNPALPGMAGFNIGKEVFDSQVEVVVDDFATMDLAPLRQFDVVLFLGVLYHLRDPFAALTRLRQVTEGVAVIETEALLLPGHEGQSLLEFTAGCYQGYDFSNWYTPTLEALRQLCLAAGFSRVEIVIGPPQDPPPGPLPTPSWRARLESAIGGRLGIRRDRPLPVPAQPRHYRALIHAFP